MKKQHRFPINHFLPSPEIAKAITDTCGERNKSFVVTSGILKNGWFCANFVFPHSELLKYVKTTSLTDLDERENNPNSLWSFEVEISETLGSLHCSFEVPKDFNYIYTNYYKYEISLMFAPMEWVRDNFFPTE